MRFFALIAAVAAINLTQESQMRAEPPAPNTGEAEAEETMGEGEAKAKEMAEASEQAKKRRTEAWTIHQSTCSLAWRV